MTKNLQKEKKPQTFVGRVVSDKMDKTIIVVVERRFIHPLFGKTLRRFKKYKVHDENEVAKEGDFVEFYVGRPVSKTKCMYISRVITSSLVQ
jgi:small subunit ribosomal protein S17